MDGQGMHNGLHECMTVLSVHHAGMNLGKQDVCFAFQLGSHTAVFVCCSYKHAVLKV